MQNRLAHIDIKLLIALQALLEESNVSNAADRLCITQPAMSKILGRLRELFDDPLLTRSGKGLVPTPKAKALRAPLIQALNNIESLIAPQDFDLSASEGTMRILYPDAAGTNLLIDFLNELHIKAPKLRLEVQSHINVQIPAVDDLELLRLGIFDFSITHEATKDPDFICIPLSNRGLVIWMRKDHPLAKKKNLKFTDLLAYPRVQLYITGYGERILATLDNAVKELGLTDTPPIRTSSLLMALEFVCRHDAIMFSSQDLGKFNLSHNQVISKAVPDGIPILQQPHTLYLIQHLRTKGSPLHQWIRKRLQESNHELVQN